MHIHVLNTHIQYNLHMLLKQHFIKDCMLETINIGRKTNINKLIKGTILQTSYYTK